MDKKEFNRFTMTCQTSYHSGGWLLFVFLHHRDRHQHLNLDFHQEGENYLGEEPVVDLGNGEVVLLSIRAQNILAHHNFIRKKIILLYSTCYSSFGISIAR